MFEDCSSSEATTPVPVQHVRPVRAKKRKQSPAPALPIVVQLMEMGFPRRNIEFALKSLTGASGNAAGLPGILFSLWVFHLICPHICLWVYLQMLTSDAYGQVGAVDPHSGCTVCTCL